VDVWFKVRAYVNQPSTVGDETCFGGDPRGSPPSRRELGLARDQRGQGDRESLRARRAAPTGSL
jgi:hypothetical protein